MRKRCKVENRKKIKMKAEEEKKRREKNISESGRKEGNRRKNIKGGRKGRKILTKMKKRKL